MQTIFHEVVRVLRRRARLFLEERSLRQHWRKCNLDQHTRVSDALEIAPSDLVGTVQPRLLGTQRRSTRPLARRGRQQDLPQGSGHSTMSLIGNIPVRWPVMRVSGRPGGALYCPPYQRISPARTVAGLLRTRELHWTFDQV